MVVGLDAAVVVGDAAGRLAVESLPHPAMRAAVSTSDAGTMRRMGRNYASGTPHPRMYADDDPYLSELRGVCLGLPETVDVEALGRPTFRAAGEATGLSPAVDHLFSRWQGVAAPSLYLDLPDPWLTSWPINAPGTTWGSTGGPIQVASRP